MSLRNYFTRHAFKHWILAFISLGIVSFLLLRIAGCYTRHNDIRIVPDVCQIPLPDAIEILEAAGMTPVVNDSSYQDGIPPLNVLEQNPESGSEVKKNRKVYLLINSVSPPLVPMPDLKDLSRREAMAILETRGLKLGKIILKPGFEAVMDQLIQGISVPPDMRVRKGLAIDLVIGTGEHMELVTVPSLAGLTKNEASERLTAVGLSLGFENYEPGIIDSTKVRIVRQYPPASSSPSVPKGETVDIWYGK